MNTETSFGGWYRAADLKPEHSLLQLRWQGIENWVNALDCMSVLELARLFYRRSPKRPDFENEFSLVFHQFDAAFPMTGNGLELAVLAGATLARVIETNRQDAALVAAFALTCPSFFGKCGSGAVPEIICQARDYLQRISSSLRATRAIQQVDLGTTRLDAETLKPMLDAVKANQPPDMAAQLLAVFQKLGDAVQNVLSRMTVLEEQQAIFREESDILWWLTGGHSRDFGGPPDKIPKPAGCLVAGKELADLTRVLPGPLAVHAFLDRFLEHAGEGYQEEVVFSQAINNADRDWQGKWIADFSNAQSLDLCPTLFAIHESMRSDQANAWNSVFKTQTGMAPNLKIASVQLAHQVYEECLFVRSSCSNGSGPMSEENSTGETAAAENASAVSADSSVTGGDAAGGTTAGMVELPVGEALTLGESLPITRAQRAQLVVIAGAVGSGKTTLIAVLFQLFQRGEFEGYLFAGSETLVGFDQRCYLARTASGRPNADTARTRPGEERQLLHLRVRRHDLATPARDILLSDLSGEDYREAKNSVEECRRLPLLGRADHFVLLIDADQLTKLDCRQKTRNEATSLLRTCLDAGQLGKFSYVDVLLSRWDLVNQDAPETMSFIAELVPFQLSDFRVFV